MRNPFAHLRFDEGAILAEQLRLLLGNVVTSTLPVVLLGSLMLIGLANEQNANRLYAWFVIVVGAKFLSYLVARRSLAGPIPPERLRAIAWSMVGFYTFNGLAWGSLPWLTWESSSTAGRVITLALMAGVVGSAVAQTSSVFAVFFGFATATLSLVFAKLLMLDDLAYRAYAGATVLYLGSLLSLGRNNAEAALAAIRLRFENAELLEKLRAETELAQAARREAVQANEAKSRFLAAASHDLRQPIHAQGLFINVLARTSLDARQRELVENMKKTSDASGEMLNTLLDFSRIEAGVVRPRQSPVALQPMLHRLAGEFGPMAEAKGIIYRSRDTRLWVRTDPALLELIVRNFIGNAIRYTERGGVLVACRRRGAEAVIEVWDTGIGIPPEQHREVFREFHQLGNPERDSRKGLGLGLAIADGLARALGHRVALASAPGHGSVFRVTLPLSEPAAALPSSSIAGDARAAALRNLQGVRVLVVDDDEAVRAGMHLLLADWGCRCAVAEGLEDALAAVREQVPDVVVSDYRLRGHRTGTDVIAALRAATRADLPALLITGDTAPERLREAEASGVPLLHKPLSSRELRARLLAALASDAKGAGQESDAESLQSELR